MAIAGNWTDVDPDLLADREHRDDALAQLAALSARLAAPGARHADLIRHACAGARRIVDAPTCRHDGDSLVVDRPLSAQDQQLLDVVDHLLALALARAELAERLTEEHLVRDLFDAIAEGRHAQAEARARAAGHDLAQPHVVAVLEPLDARTAALAEARLRATVPAGGALFDAADDRLRALLPAPPDLERLDAELAAIAREHRVAAGRSEPRAGVAAAGRALQEATIAARVARATAPATTGAACAYDQLGAYRYLAQLPPGHAPDDRHARAIATLAAYDARRRTELLRTLERHLGDRGALAATARALYIHTNTLRQRLDRIESLTGLDLTTEDLLSLELALKLARLHGTPPGVSPSP
jgi:DNA-binding PucR family transcriptional regulator